MTSSLRRLAADHAALHRSGLPPYYLLPATNTADDLTQLHILLAGPPGTPYEDGLWRLQLKMPPTYPKSPPKAYFRTKIWHPNVEESTGSVCLDTLKRDWDAKLTLRDILITISCLLINPNPDSALNAAAGHLLQTDWAQFAQHARLMTSIHAKVPAGQRAAVQEARTRGEATSTASTGAESETSRSEETRDATQDAQPSAAFTIHAGAADDDDDEEEEENQKENDMAFNLPMRDRRPPPPAIRRSTVLGKRPLADLPVPEEPPTDDEEEYDGMTASLRNIAANTPNLSTNLANVSFTPSVARLDTSSTSIAALHCRTPSTTKLAERAQDFNFSSSSTAANQPVEFRARSLISGNPDAETQFPAAPAAKRLCRTVSVDRDGKENAVLLHGLKARGNASSELAPAGLVGLGLKSVSVGSAGLSAIASSGPASAVGCLPAVRKIAGAGGASASRPKARVGMRRL